MPRLMELAGNVPAEDIAGEFGVTVKTLRWKCAQLKISLKCDEAKLRGLAKTKARVPPEVKIAAQNAALEKQLEEASTLLLSHGWRVLRPDPFRQYIDEPRRQGKAA